MSSKPIGPAERPTIILASGSPRRHELLARLGWAFEAHAPNVDEHVAGTPREMVDQLSERKARAAAADFSSGIVLGADTLVAVRGEALGKPRDEADARRMLGMLSGRKHEVLTGVCMLDIASGRMVKRVECTQVRFAELTERDIDEYVATGEPMGKAGAYAIQGDAGAFVTEINGSFENVMGLPVEVLELMLRQLGGGQDQ